MADGTITAKQKEILEYIKSEILKRGFPPAVREICEAVHLKGNPVAAALPSLGALLAAGAGVLYKIRSRRWVL